MLLRLDYQLLFVCSFLLISFLYFQSINWDLSTTFIKTFSKQILFDHRGSQSCLILRMFSLSFLKIIKIKTVLEFINICWTKDFTIAFLGFLQISQPSTLPVTTAEIVFAISSIVPLQTQNLWYLFNIYLHRPHISRHNFPLHSHSRRSLSFFFELFCIFCGLLR